MLLKRCPTNWESPEYKARLVQMLVCVGRYIHEYQKPVIEANHGKQYTQASKSTYTKCTGSIAVTEITKLRSDCFWKLTAFGADNIPWLALKFFAAVYSELYKRIVRLPPFNQRKKGDWYYLWRDFQQFAIFCFWKSNWLILVWSVIKQI